MIPSINPTVSQPPAQIQSVPPRHRFSKSWLKMAHRARAVTLFLLKALLACPSWVIKKATPYSRLQKETLALLDEKADQTDIYIQKMYYNELQEQVGRLPPRTAPSKLLKSIDQTAAELEALAHHASTGVDKIVERLQGQMSVEHLKKTWREALKHGQLTLQKMRTQVDQTFLDPEVKKKFKDTLDQVQPDSKESIDELLKEFDQMPIVPIQQLTREADQLYRHCMDSFETLKKLPGTQVQRALYTGRLVTTFRRLDDAFSDIEGKTLHRYCCCHIQPETEDGGLKLLSPGIRGRNPKFLVPHQKKEVEGELPKHTSAVIMSQSYGGGHNVIQHATSQRIAERGGHAYKIEADDEVLEAYYNYRKWTGRSGTEWSELLLQKNAFRLIRFLGWISGGRDTPESREGKVHCFALSLLARGQQDLAITCFQRNTSPSEKAASRLGMGFLEIAPDLDYTVLDFDKDVENPHFIHGMMASDPEREKPILEKSLQVGQYAELGFSVRDPFLKKYTPEELAALREKYRQKYNLAPDARVVILLCGSAGVANTIAETLIDKYPENGPKIHLFAICGKNAEKRETLAQQFQTLNLANLKASALGWTEEQELGELFAMGALEKEKGLLISAKAGGGTVSEAIARGIPALVSEMGGLVHEKLNLDFLVTKQLGQSFKKEEEVPQKVLGMLTHPLTPQLSPAGESYADFHSKEKSAKLIRNIVQDCRKDTMFQANKASLMQPLPPAFSLTQNKRHKIEKLLQNYGWEDKDLLAKELTCRPRYEEFLEFLYDSRLIYSLRGQALSLQNSSSDMKEGIKMMDGQPHLLKENRWVRWDQIIETFKYDRNHGITSSKASNATWNYLYPDGLMQKSRYNQIFPVHQLSQDELGRLYEHSQKFHGQASGAALPPKNECAYIQIVTHVEDALDRVGGHASVRLIDSDGRVFSIGLEIPQEEVNAMKVSSLLGTRNAALTSPDYKEFAKFKYRRVTTVPVNAATFQKIFTKVQQYTTIPLRHNYIHQNCVTFAADILHEAGVPVETTSPSITCVLVPKGIRKAAQLVHRFFSGTPNCIKTAAERGWDCFTMIPSKATTLFKNATFLALGAGREATPPKPGAENVLDHQQRLTSFNHLFTRWGDLFKDPSIDMSHKLIDWQMEQGSTEMHPYAGPKFYVVPG